MVRPVLKLAIKPVDGPNRLAGETHSPLRSPDGSRTSSMVPSACESQMYASL